MGTVCEEKDIVLVVDDEEMVEEMIEALVEEHGCAHVSFNNPAEALRYYEENSRKITLMITDLTMPSLSGPDLIKNVLQVNPQLPVILVTGYPNEQIPADIPPLVRRILPKPFTKSELLEAVRTAFDKARS
jgi:two-component system, cell cycle sensor histidine kinase and response regulator CckA